MKNAKTCLLIENCLRKNNYGIVQEFAIYEPLDLSLFLYCLQAKNGFYNFRELRRTNKRRSEKAMAPHSSTLAWKIPWTEEPGRLQSMGSLRVGHD